MTRPSPSDVAADQPPKAPSRRTRLPLDDRRDQLIQLGLELFSRKPYEEVHISELSDAARISKGLLYHYFPTKRHFYIAALRVAADRLLAQTELAPSLPPLVRLQTGLDRLLQYIEGYAPSFVALMRGGVGGDPQLAALVEETRTRYMTRILSGLGHAEDASPLLRVALRGFIGYVEAASLEWMIHKALPREELVAHLSTLFLSTVLTLGAVPPQLE